MEGRIGFLDQAEQLMGGASPGMDLPEEKPVTEVVDDEEGKELIKKAQEQREAAIKAMQNKKDHKEEDEEQEEGEEEPQEKPKRGRPKKEVEPEPEMVPDNSLMTDIVKALAEHNGWDEQDLIFPETAEEFIEYISAVISENSKPQFASAEVERINNFVENGGNLHDIL